MSAAHEPLDPWAIIGALEKHRVNYVLIGSLAGVLHGTDEIADRVEICPQMKGENLERLRAALVELVPGESTVDDEALRSSPVTSVPTSAGTLDIVPTPAGSGGWEDIRRASTREPLGRGIRASVASVDDLARVVASQERAEDAERLGVLRRLSERDRSRGIGR